MHFNTSPVSPIHVKFHVSLAEGGLGSLEVGDGMVLGKWNDSLFREQGLGPKPSTLNL